MISTNWREYAAHGLWLLALPLGTEAYPSLHGPANSTLALSELDLRVVCGSIEEIYCTDFDVTCLSSDSCCTATKCCKPGYACRSGACVVEPVVTSCLTSTKTVTSTLVSSVLSTILSTYWVVTTPSATTVVATTQNGVATDTVWVTVTTLLKRDTIPIETGFTDGIAPPLPGATKRAFMGGEHQGLNLRDILGKRTSVAYITVPYSTTLYKYNYITSLVTRWITSTSAAGVPTVTSVVFNGASTTVTTTLTTTVTSRSPPPSSDTTPAVSTPSPSPSPSPAASSSTTSHTPQQAPTSPVVNPPAQDSSISQAPTTPVAPATATVTISPTYVTTGSNTPTLALTTATSSGVAVVYWTAPESNSNSGSLSSSATIGVGVGASVGAVVLLSGQGFIFWRWRKKRSGSNDSATASLTPGPPAAGSDVMSSRAESRMTGMGFTAFEGKMVSPHSSMAGSPPPTDRATPAPFTPPEPFPPGPAQMASNGSMAAGYSPSRSDHMSWGSMHPSDIQEAPSSPSWSERGTNAELYAPNIYEAPQSHVIHEAPPEPYHEHIVHEAPEQYQEPYLAHGGANQQPQGEHQPAYQHVWR